MADDEDVQEEAPDDADDGDDDDDDDQEDDETEGEEDDESGDWHKNFLLVLSYGTLAFFVVTDPAGAAELGRNIGHFLGEQAASVVEFLDATFAETPTDS